MWWKKKQRFDMGSLIRDLNIETIWTLGNKYPHCQKSHCVFEKINLRCKSLSSDLNCWTRKFETT